MTFFKRKPYRNPKLLKAAKGEPCLFRGPTCNGDASTVVACHSNLGEDGKGMGQKADDDCSFYGCSACHDLYDKGWTRSAFTIKEVQAMADRAIIRTMRRRREQGL